MYISINNYNIELWAPIRQEIVLRAAAIHVLLYVL